MTETLRLTIWDRDFTLPIEYECYTDERVTRQQKKAAKRFFDHKEWIEASKTNVEEYCREQVLEDDENQKKENIFSYIKPEYLFIKRDAKAPRIALMCKYRYDLEHGLAIVFSYDGNVTIGVQDIIL